MYQDASPVCHHSGSLPCSTVLFGCEEDVLHHVRLVFKHLQLPHFHHLDYCTSKITSKAILQNHTKDARCNTTSTAMWNTILSLPNLMPLTTVLLCSQKQHFNSHHNETVSSYRPITLLSVPKKVSAHVLLARIQPLLDMTRRPQQSGFAAGRSTIDAILALRLLSEIHWEFDCPLQAAYLDIKAAFDSVDRRALWKALRGLEAYRTFC